MAQRSATGNRTRALAGLVLSWLLLSACEHERMHAEEAADGHGSEVDAGAVGELLPLPKAAEDCKGLLKWLSKHTDQLTVRAVRAGLVLEASYRPAACVACMEDEEAAFADGTYRQRVGELRHAETYVLKMLTHPGLQDTLDLEWNEELAGSLVEVVGQDTFPCAFMHMEALPSMLPYRSALVGFDRPQDGRERRLVLRDRSGRWGGDLAWVFHERALRAYMAIAPDTLTSPRS